MLLVVVASLIACLPVSEENARPADSDTDTAVPADTGGDTAADTDTAADEDPGFVRLPASTFEMGMTPSQPDMLNNDLHSVTLTHDYSVGITEVSQGEFEAVMGYNPSRVDDCAGGEPGECPVEMVTWYESAAYASKLSAVAGLQECYTCWGSEADTLCTVEVEPYDCAGYRLLTEAEWEGAARCGTDLVYAGSDTVSDVAWTNENAGGSTHAGADLLPNGCGLYDMSGNVFEWTHDGYDDYPSGAVTDPVGEESGKYRVLRGGGWDVPPAVVSSRAGAMPVMTYQDVGFRLARTRP